MRYTCIDFSWWILLWQQVIQLSNALATCSVGRPTASSSSPLMTPQKRTHECVNSFAKVTISCEIMCVPKWVQFRFSIDRGIFNLIIGLAGLAIGSIRSGESIAQSNWIQQYVILTTASSAFESGERLIVAPFVFSARSEPSTCVFENTLLAWERCYKPPQTQTRTQTQTS